MKIVIITVIVTITVTTITIIVVIRIQGGFCILVAWNSASVKLREVELLYLAPIWVPHMVLGGPGDLVSGL